MKQKFYTTGSMAYNWFTRFLVLTCLLFGFGSTSFADSGFWGSNAANVKISGSWKGEMNSSGASDINLGTVTSSPIIEQAWAKVWGDGAINRVYFCYKINGGSITEIGSDNQNLGSGDKQYNWNSLNISLPSATGEYVVEFWFKTNNDRYLSNNSANYKIKYKVEDPTPDPTPAIKCDPQNTKVIFQENFDFKDLTDETSRCSYLRTKANDGYDAWIPAKGSSGAQGYTYMEACKAMKYNGYYAVVVNAQWGGCGNQANEDPNACKCNDAKWFRDVTSRSGSGGMLMYNANNGKESTPDILYACKVDVCADTYINFTAHIAPANASRPGTGCDNNYDDAAVKFVLRDSETQQILATQTISDIKLTAGWQELSAMFKSGAAKNGEKEKSVTIEFVNIAPAGDCGNDLLIDDITLSVCTPSASLTTSNGSNTNTIISGMSETLTAHLLSGIMDNPYFLWQFNDTNNPMSTWQPLYDANGQPLSGVNQQTITVTPESFTTEYRVIVAPNEAAALDVAANRTADNICGMYAITNTATVTTKPIEVTINQPVAICKGENAKFVITVKNPLDIAISNVKLRVIPPTVMENNAKAEPTASYDANKREWTIASLQGSPTFTYEAIPTGVGHLNFQAHISAIGNDITYISYDDPTLPPASKALSSIDVMNIEFIENPISVSSACEDSKVEFKTSAKSSCEADVTYQWVRRVKGSSDDFTAISGATGTTYIISELTAADADYEYAVWANASGCPCKNVLSNVATITFVPKTTVPTAVKDYYDCQETGKQQLKELVTVDLPDNLVFYTTKTGTETVTEFDKNIPISTTYSFTYQETDKCTSDRGELSVIVLATPVATITSDATQRVCAEESHTFTVTATAQNGVGKWEVASVTGGTASIETTTTGSAKVTVSAGATANVTWTVVAPDAKCDATASTTLIVDKKPEAEIETGKGSQEACAKDNFTVAVKPHAGTGLWSFVGNSNGAIIESPTAFETKVSNIQLGKKVTLKYTASNGVCDDVTSAEVTLENLICNNLVLENGVNDGEVCKNEEVIFTICITNHSTVASTAVKAEVKLPSGLEYLETIPASATYSPQTGVWKVGDLAVNGVATLQIKVKALDTSTLTAKIVEASSETMNIEDDAKVTVFELPTAKFNAASSEICGSINERSAIGVTLTGKAPYTLTYTLDGVEKTDPRVYSPHSIAQSLTDQKDYQFALTKVVDANGCKADISGETHTVTVDKYAEVGNIDEVSAICQDKELTLPKLPTITANGSTVSAGKWLLNNIELTSNVLSVNDNGKKLKYMVESTCGTQAPKPIYSNEVTVTVDENPSPAVIASEKIEQCNDPVFNVTANPITVGKGAWSIVSGDVKGISPIDNNVTKVTLADDFIDKAAKVKWTVSNGACESKSDEVELINNNCTAIEIVPYGVGPAVCNGSLATFEFTLTNASVVDVKDVTLELTLGSGLALQSATVSSNQFIAGKCVIPSMPKGARMHVEVKAKATVDNAAVTIKVTKSSNKDVIGVEASQTVTVHSIPTATFELNNSVVCASEAQNTAIEVNFTGAPNFDLTYTVDGVTRNATSVPNPYIIKESLTGVGSHSIKLVSVKDANECVGKVNDQEHTTKVEKYATLGTIADVKPICEESVVALPTEPTIYENSSTISDKKWMLDGTSIDATTLIPYTTETQKLWYQVGSTCGTYTKTITSNEVDLKVDQKPTTAVAGPNQTKCNDDEFTMAANAPQIGSGKWSVVGTSVLNYEEGNPTTLVKGVPETQSVDLVWTISSKLGVCKPSTSTVTLTNNNCANFTLDVVGDPSQVCPNGTANFNFTLKNTATVAVNNVKLTLTLEEGLTLVSAKVESLSFGADNKITIQQMAAGASVTIKVVATADANANDKKVTIRVEESSGVPVGMSANQKVVVNQNPVVTNIKSYTGEDPTKPGVKQSTVLTCATPILYLHPTIQSENEVSYTWTPNATSKINPVRVPGTYTLTVKDNATGCTSAENSIVITENKVYPVLDDIIPTTKVIVDGESYEEIDVLDCNNQSLILNPIIKDQNGNPYTRDLEFVWSEVDENGNVIAKGGTGKTETVIKPGFYILEIKDKETGCPGNLKTVEIKKDVTKPVIKNIISYTKEDPNDPERKESNVLTCANPALYLSPEIESTNGVTYLWNTGSKEKVLKVENPGTYTLVVTDTKTGCPTEAFECVITENKKTPEIKEVISATTENMEDENYKETTVLDCNNPELILTPVIKDADGNIYPAEDIIFVWTKIDENGKVIKIGEGKTQKVTEKDVITVQVIDKETGCPSNKFEITITDDYTTPVITNIISYTKEDLDDPKVEESNVLTCANPILYLNPVIESENGVTYLWSTGETTKMIKVEEAGTYTLVVTDVVTGCSTEAFECVITENKKTPEIKEVISATTENMEDENYKETTVLDCNNPELILTPVIKDADGNIYPAEDIIFVWTKIDENGKVIKIGEGKTQKVTEKDVITVQVIDKETGCPSNKFEITITDDYTKPVITNIISYTKEDLDDPKVEESNVLTCANPILYLNPVIESENDVTYLWNTGDTTRVLVVETAGTYTLVVTDTKTGCSTEAFECEITENKIYPVIKEVNSSNIEDMEDENYKETTVLDCNNPELILTPVIKDSEGNAYAEGDITYVWTTTDENGDIIIIGTGKTITVTKEGGYELQVFDANTGCPGQKVVVNITKNTTTPVITNIISYTKEDLDDPKVEESNVLTCANPVLYLNPVIESENGVTYLWNTGDTTRVLVVEEAGTYTLVVTDVVTGCSTEAFECVITENKKFPVVNEVKSSNTEDMDDENYKETTVLDCNNPELILTPVIKDSEGNPYPEEDITYVWSTTDEYGNIIIVGTGKTITVAKEGGYELQVIDAKTGCPGEKKVVEITKNTNAPIITNIISSTTVDSDDPEYKETNVLTCAVTELYLTPKVEGAANVTYLWSTGETTQVKRVDAAGTYSLVVTDTETGCASAEFEFTVTENNEAPIVDFEDVYYICPSDTMQTITLSSFLPKKDGVTYKFYDESGEEIADLYDAPETDEVRTYYASAISANGCESAAVAFNIDFVGAPAFRLEVSESPVLVGGNETVVTVIPEDNGVAIDKYTWKENGSVIPFNGEEYVNNLYLDTKFEVIASNRCASTSQEATVQVLWPTAFTPHNKNGKNDDFAKGMKLIVFNRFYTKIFEGEDGWDGTINGAMNDSRTIAVPGVYYYSVQLPNGQVKKGTIEIVKVE